MKTDNGKIRYKSDVMLKQIRSNIFVVLSYIFLIWLWQFTLSFQSSMYTLMNVAVFVMWGFGAVGTLICKEDQEAIIKHTKHQVTYYLVVVFVYDLFLRVVVNDMAYSAAGYDVDPSLSVARQFLLVVSTMLKIGFPIAFVVWMIQKFAIFKNGFTKQKQIEVLRNIRKNLNIKGEKNNNLKEKDNINNRY